MITLYLHQPLKTDNNLLVYTAGDYNETDLVSLCSIDNLNISYCSHQAFFVQFGVMYDENN